MNNLTLSEIDVNFKVAIENQNRFKVKVKKCKLFITIENIELGWVELDEKTDLLGKQVSLLPLNFKGLFFTYKFYHMFLLFIILLFLFIIK